MGGPLKEISVCVEKRTVTVHTQPVLNEWGEWDESNTTSKVALTLRQRDLTQTPSDSVPINRYTLVECADCELARNCGWMKVYRMQPSGEDQPQRFSGSATINADVYDENPPCRYGNDLTLMYLGDM